MQPILKCININKYFGKKQVLKNINLDLSEGDILGFIGPNGSGKTTTIKSILGLQKIRSGQIIINGYDLERHFEKAMEKVGSIVENPDSYMYLTGYSNLLLVKNLYKNITKDDISSVVKLVGLENRIHDKVSKYSLGMRQRLGIAMSLLIKPNILLLDEPTNGLDPEGIKDLRTLLKKLAKEGMGILISSHNLAELESFCNKVCIINKGEIIETTDIRKIKKETNIYQFTLSKKPNLKGFKTLDKGQYLIKSNEEEIPSLVKKIVNEDILIYEVKQLELTLEEAFLNKTGGSKID